MRCSVLWIASVALAASALNAQPLKPAGFTPADTLRGTNGPFRSWWDVSHYDVSVRPDFATHSIKGKTTITFRTVQVGQRMQIDLQAPLAIESVTFATEGERVDLHFTQEGNVAWIALPRSLQTGETGVLAIAYAGVPRKAVNPPWDGGWVWKTDQQGNPWMSVACQGLGASVWFPCKDTQADEPDSAALHITVPDSLQAVGNGRLRSVMKNGDGSSTWTWAVVNPINNYNIIPSIGKYVRIHEVYQGLDGPLDLDYWVLGDHDAEARRQFQQVPSMLQCFEEWFGPYPFYRDGYKLVETPFLGMEHQSAIAYGNHFQNGYLGTDLSGTGWGLKWDYVVVHESGHEWFGNSITSRDIADMWVHESFTDYSETLYTQCQFGEAAGDDYVIGLRKNIRNDTPIQGPFGVNQEGSTDMYYKGANMLHTIRHIMGNDSLFKAMLREMNSVFRHRVVSGAEVESFIIHFSGCDLGKLFDQYLRTTMVPELQWTIKKGKLYLRWSNCVAGLSMPVQILLNGEERLVYVGSTWSTPAHGLRAKTIHILPDRNWYITARRVGKGLLRER